MPLATCPQCGCAVQLDEPSEGNMVHCSNCRAMLEVLNVEPLELDWAFYRRPLLELWEENEIRS